MATALKTRLLGSQSDERLSKLARDGSQIAFEALARRYRRALLRHCRQLCLSQESAQEVLQRSLAEAWSGIQAGAEPQDPRSWLYGIAQRIATEQMRGAADAADASAGGLKAAVAEAEMPGRGAAANGVPTPDEVLALRSALSAMTPRRERDGIVVHRADGNKVAEDGLGIVDSAVRGLLGRARRGISALTPPPLLAWALSRAAESGPSGERLAELGAGGAAGITGLAVKVAVVALTAGVAITGAVVARSGSHPHAGGSAHPAVGARSSSSASLAAGTGPGAGSGGGDASAGRHGGGRSGGHHILVASITSPKQTSVSSGPSTQGSGGAGSSAAGAQPSGQSPAGSPQTREVRVQTSTTVTQNASGGGAGTGSVGTGVSASASVSVESSSTGSTSQSGGGSAGIGVNVSLGGESGQQGGSGGTTSGSGASSGGSSGEPSSSSELSSTGIGISVSLEPMASVGVHVHLP